MAGARETIAMLLTDVAGSTLLWRRAPDAMDAALKRHDEIVDDVARRFEGVRPADQGEGDSRFLVFDAARQAVEAALALQGELEREQWPTPEPMRVRIGLHAGDAIRRGDNVLGEVVSKCARLRDAAHPGQVLVSAAVEAVLGGDLPPGATLRHLGAHLLPDLARPESIYQLCHEQLPDDFPPVRSLDDSRHNLPVQLSSFVGREGDVAAVIRLIEESRLVTITGFGGVGKTRLALHVAGRAAAVGAGAYFVDLSTVRDPARLLDAVAAALDVRAGESRDLLVGLAKRLSAEGVLLVLDNLEQVVAAAPTVLDLLGAAPAVRLLVTSREPLRLRGEREYALEPLEVPDERGGASALTAYPSVQLFIDRAREVVADFPVDDDALAAMAAICARLDGLPLAIELAAARVKVLPPRALLARLAGRLDLPGSAARDLPGRHQTLRATIEWSYDLLEPAEQALLARLSVFAGGAPLEAVEAVCAADCPDVVGVLTSLVDKSLVRQRPGDDAEPRYETFQTVRDFAAERLAEQPDECSGVADRHAEYFRDAVAALVVGRFTEDGAVAFVQRELDNVRVALDHLRDVGRVDDEAQLLADIADAVWHRGHWDELIRRSVDLLERMPRPSETSFTLLDCVAVGSLTSDLVRAEEWSHRAIDEAAALGRPVLEGRSWVWLGHLRQLRGELDAAEDAVLRGLRLAEEAQADAPRYRFYERAVVLCEGAAIEAGLAIRRAQWAAATSAAERALSRAERLGDADSRIRGHVRLGGAALGGGQLELATTSFATAVELCRGSGVRGYLPLLLAQLADVQRRRGGLAAARASLDEARRVAAELGVLEPLVDLVAAHCAVDAGDLSAAKCSLDQLPGALSGESAVRAGVLAAQIAVAEGVAETARVQLAAGLRRCAAEGLQSGVTSLLRLAATAVPDPSLEASLLRAAERHRDDPGPVFLRELVPPPAELPGGDHADPPPLDELIARLEE
ncbi:MAG TPA: AAA family ATPase [Mycobacteriales bacterium]|nr:AAA family ATPase [Mycobacteriales bacterium]